MDYGDIIAANQLGHSPVSWWPKYAFHFTDVRNAVGILRSGTMFCRALAKQLNVMQNENASKIVIDMTSEDVKGYVRLYFRPLTPTQYHNEGFKHPMMRLGNGDDANSPVPVFFMFDLVRILSLPGTRFSEISMAKNDGKMRSGFDEFSNLPFDKIYDNAWQNLKTTKPYRHAEILYPSQLYINQAIRFICCRNELEAQTLCNLLRDANPRAFCQYRNYIRVYNKDLFYNNGLFVNRCEYVKESVIITFDDSFARKEYIASMRRHTNGIGALDRLSVRVCLQWFNADQLISEWSVSVPVDIENPIPIYLTPIPAEAKADFLKIRVYIDEKLMAYTRHPLNGGSAPF